MSPTVANLPCPAAQERAVPILLTRLLLVRTRAERCALTWWCDCQRQHLHWLPPSVAQRYRFLGVRIVHLAGDPELRDHRRDFEGAALTEEEIDDVVFDAAIAMGKAGPCLVDLFPAAVVDDVAKAFRLEAAAKDRLSGIVHHAAGGTS
jgi:hypothetical protein